MLSRRWAKYVALVLLIGMLVPTGLALSNRGSDGATPEEVARQQSEAARQRCVGYARSVARQLQTYVARFDASVASAASAAGGAPPAFPSVARLRDQVAQVTGSVGGNGCDPAVFRAALAHGLGGVRGTTDLGSALASTLVANVRDVLDPAVPAGCRSLPGTTCSPGSTACPVARPWCSPPAPTGSTDRWWCSRT